MNNKIKTTLLLFQCSIPAQSEPNRITAMAIRGAPHFSQKIKHHQKLTRSQAFAWQRMRIRLARALTRPSDQQPQSYCAKQGTKHRAKDRVRFLSAHKTRKRRLIASARQLLLEKNPFIGNEGQGQ